MKTINGFRVSGETEKAIKIDVAFVYSQNAESIVYTIREGEQENNTGWVKSMWVPKSLVDANGNIAQWFVQNEIIPTIKKVTKFSPMSKILI